LASLLPQVAKLVDELRAKHEYEAALVEISRLRPAVDLFFDKVMVMVTMSEFARIGLRFCKSFWRIFPLSQIFRKS